MEKLKEDKSQLQVSGGGGGGSGGISSIDEKKWMKERE